MDDSISQLSQASSSQRQSSPSPPQKVHKKDANKNKNKIVINISDCQYSVVRKVAKEFGWKKQKEKQSMDWDVLWTDNAVQPEMLSKMELHQKINHFPGMYNLARKNLLGRGLMRMRKKFPEQFDFFPLTWMLPVQYHQLKAYFDGKAKGKARTFIVKPECMSQGKGIFLTRKLDDINPSNHCVVQRYMHKPYLIDGLKFDLRVYVLVTSVDPLTIYLYEQGLGRFATQKYEAPTRDNMEDVCMHLTNYAINKDNPNFVFNQSAKDMSKGHKKSLTSVYQMLKSQGVDVDKLKGKIKDCIIKTMISGLPHLTNTYKSCQPENYAGNMCFQLLGFDVMLNDKAQPYILQINHTPSFSTDTPLDLFIKFNYIKDALTIMNITQKYKNQVVKMQKEACQQRVITGKKVKLTPEEREHKKIQAVQKKRKFQKKHLGKFQRIYPTEQPIDPYKQFITYADQVYQISVGGKRVSKKQEKVEEAKPVIKPRSRKTNLSTTPDLITRKPIAERKFQSKPSLNFIQTENRQDKEQSPNRQPLIPKKVQSQLQRASQPVQQPILKTTKIQMQTQMAPISRTPQQLTNNYTKEFATRGKTQKALTIDKDQFHDKDFTRQYKSIRKIGPGVREDHYDRHHHKDKDKIFKSINGKQKIPITLNTLLINGIEQQNNFLMGNLKKYVIFKNGKYE